MSHQLQQKNENIVVVATLNDEMIKLWYSPIVSGPILESKSKRAIFQKKSRKTAKNMFKKGKKGQNM